MGKPINNSHHTDKYPDYRDIIQASYELKRVRNPGYSVRAYARDLGMAASTLSEVLNKRHGISPVRARKIAQKIGLSPDRAQFFCGLVDFEHAKTEIDRVRAKETVESMLESGEYDCLGQDTWRAVADWYYLAILELIKLPRFTASHDSIAKALDLTKDKVSEALGRLQRLTLVKRLKGKLSVTSSRVSIGGQGVPSEAIKLGHDQTLEKAREALYAQPLEGRDFSSIYMHVTPAALPRAKELLKEFRRNFAAEMLRYEDPSRVYCLSMQFFDLCPSLDDQD